MTELKPKFGGRIEVDRDYMGAIGEDVRLIVDDYIDGDSNLTLTPDEADELAEWLKYHAEEVRTINKENGLA